MARCCQRWLRNRQSAKRRVSPRVQVVEDRPIRTFNSRTVRSLFMATRERRRVRAPAPGSARARCKRSKTPFVKTSRLPAARRRLRSRSICSGQNLFDVSERLQDLADVCIIIAHFMSIPFPKITIKHSRGASISKHCARSSATSIQTNSSAVGLSIRKRDTISSVLEKFEALNRRYRTKAGLHLKCSSKPISS